MIECSTCTGWTDGKGFLLVHQHLCEFLYYTKQKVDCLEQIIAKIVLIVFKIDYRLKIRPLEIPDLPKKTKQINK